jgi:hypothetical protein
MAGLVMGLVFLSVFWVLAGACQLPEARHTPGSRTLVSP